MIRNLMMFLKWLKPMSELEAIEMHLSQATDHSDLERRMREVDRSRNRLY